jgi:cysteinyl-tRNA synthetase
MTLHVYNTLTRRKEAFAPLEPGKVRMYNCGPTVYSYAHIGNFASFLMADLLRRTLEYTGFEVLQVMNITDVGHLTEDNIADARGEDKLEKKAREEKKDPWEIARFYEAAFHEDRERLNLLPAHHYPRATEHIPEMLQLIGELLQAGLAYESGGQIYFDIAKFPQYGILSGNTTEELRAGHRVEEDPLKRNPLDFTLWKKDPKHLMQWDSPHGRGFPGWHIECSAMSRRYLGEVFDIHTGGEDNIFPHHECEIAQSSGGVGRIFARYWLHRRHILVDGRKMSKSAGNFFTVRDLLARGYTGAEIRLGLLGGHYRSHSNFSLQGLDDARKTLRYWKELLLNMGSLPPGKGAPAESNAVRDLARRSDAAFRAALEDDLNISAAVAEVHGFAGAVYKVVTGREAGEIASGQLRAWDRVLGVLGEPGGAGAGAAGGSAAGAGHQPGRLSAPEVEALLKQRAEARSRKDFKESDRLRDLLRKGGVIIKDTPEGTRWHHEP